MNSCLYKCKVMHHRLTPVAHKFIYNSFMFYLDLDEIDVFSKTLWLMSRNKFNVYNFRDKDHLGIIEGNVKQNIIEYLGKNGIDLKNGRVMLLTNLATFGYNFNPVSFYFCFSSSGKPICSVPEVGNTFGEIKPFLLNEDKLHENEFKSKEVKYFYVSPFTEPDSTFEFRLKIPAEKLKINIDDYRKGKKFFLSSLTGIRTTLNDWNLFLFALKYPLITLKIIYAIHWQALKLYLKKVPYYRKNEKLELQKGWVNK